MSDNGGTHYRIDNARGIISDDALDIGPISEICEWSTTEGWGEIGSESWEECQRQADACQCGRKNCISEHIRDYNTYQNLCAYLDGIDPECILQARLMGGIVSAIFTLLKSSPNLELFKRKILETFPTALVSEATREELKPAMFY
jgi:hypothetical protein